MRLILALLAALATSSALAQSALMSRAPADRMTVAPPGAGVTPRALSLWARDVQGITSFVGADVTGLTSSSQAFASAIADKPHVLVTPGTYRLSTSVTVPASVTLDFQGGACLAPDAGVTVTILGPIRAPLGRIFCGAGAIAGLKEGRPEWWGADGTAAGDTAGTVASLAASQTTLASARRYRFSSGQVVVGDGKSYRGSGSGNNGSIIEAVDSSGDTLTLTGSAQASGFFFTSGSTRTGGCYVRFNGPTGRGRLTDAQMWFYYDGACISDGADTGLIAGLKLFAGTGSRYGIDMAGGFNWLFDDLYAVADAANQPQACIHITQAGNVTIRGARLTTCGVPIFADVADGKYIASLESSDSYSDTSKYSVRLRSQGTGIITRASFINPWLGNAINEAVLIENNGTGKIADVAFVHPRLTFNGRSAFRTVGTVSALTITAPVAYGNGKCLMANPGNLPCTTGTPGQYAAFDFSAGTTVYMTNPMIGATSEGPGNTAAIKAVAGTTGSIVGGLIGTNDFGLQDGSSGLRYIGVQGVQTALRTQVSISAGANAVTVPLSLPFAPSASDIIVGYASNPGATGVGQCWPSAYSASSLTITCSNNANAGTTQYLNVDVGVSKGRAN